MSGKLRIVFMGTPEFAVGTLDALIKENFNVVGVITATDKLGGRGRKQIIESAVKKYAQAHNIPILQPPNLKSPIFLKKLQAWNADIQIVVAFRMLPVVVWDMPRLGTYNLHGSLLPAYRGAAPIHWAVINGEEKTGVTSFKLKHEIDTGNLAFQRSIPIHRNDTTGNVHDRMIPIAGQVIIQTLRAIENNQIQLIEQDESKVSKAPKIFHEDCEIQLDKTPFQIYNFVRGLNPYPLAWMLLWEKKIKILRVTYTYDINYHPNGTTITDGKKYLAIKCHSGYIFLEEIKPEGKGKMKISDYLNGIHAIPKTSIALSKPQLLS